MELSHMKEILYILIRVCVTYLCPFVKYAQLRFMHFSKYKFYPHKTPITIKTLAGMGWR